MQIHGCTEQPTPLSHTHADTVIAPTHSLSEVHLAPGTPLFRLAPRRGTLGSDITLEEEQIVWAEWLEQPLKDVTHRWAALYNSSGFTGRYAKLPYQSSMAVPVQPLFSARQFYCPSYYFSETGRLTQKHSPKSDQIFVTGQDDDYLRGVNGNGEPQFFPLSCLSLNRPELYVVFDLDQTLLWSECSNPQSLTKISYAYGMDCLADGVPELLRWLHLMPNLKVVFWSASPLSRIRSLLSNIHVTPQQTALDIATAILSDVDLTHKRNKDLHRINPDISNIIMFDDKATELADQRDHWVNLADGAMLFSDVILDQPQDPASLQAIARLAAEYPLAERRRRIARHLEARRFKAFVIGGLIAELLHKLETGLVLSEALATMREEQQARLATHAWAHETYATDWVWDDTLATLGMQTLRMLNPPLSMPDASWLMEGVYYNDLETDEEYVRFRDVCLFPHPMDETRWVTRPLSLNHPPGCSLTS